jgi:muconolactone delta-isomerase
MEYNFHIKDENFLNELMKPLRDSIYGKVKVDPLAKLPEDELVSEDEFISMMVGE